MAGRTGWLAAGDDWLARKLDRLGDELDIGWLRLEQPDGASAPVVVVVDLAVGAALEQVAEVRRRWPDTLVAGYLGVPDPELWLAGQRAGCDLVANRGALVARLRPLLTAGRAHTRLFPLVAEADLPGRLGLVAQIADTPVGPVALYHSDGEVTAISDVCPHAGARLSDGEVAGCVITCPRHGSQFDVRTGERLRGPSDVAIPTLPVVTANGQVSIALDAGPPVRH